MMGIYHFATSVDGKVAYTGSDEFDTDQCARSELMRYARDLLSEKDFSELEQGLQIQLIDEAGDRLSSVIINVDSRSAKSSFPHISG
jgi:hypothetical protein